MLWLEGETAGDVYFRGREFADHKMAEILLIRRDLL